MENSFKLKEYLLNAANNLSSEKVWLIYDKECIFIFGSLCSKIKIKKTNLEDSLNQLHTNGFCLYEKLFYNQYLITLKENI